MLVFGVATAIICFSVWCLHDKSCQSIPGNKLSMICGCHDITDLISADKSLPESQNSPKTELEMEQCPAYGILKTY